jgi:hypothetical protein
MKWGVILALLAGLVAAIYLVWSIGFGAVFGAVARAGFGGLAVLCLFALLVFVSLAFAWYFLLPPAHRRPWPELYIGRLVRDSIAEISPFSPVGGMVAAVVTTMVTTRIRTSASPTDCDVRSVRGCGTRKKTQAE